MNKKDKLKKLDSQRVVTEQTILWFGKWRNHSVQYVIDQDPGYLIWAMDEGIILFNDETYMAIQRATETMNDNKNYRED
jgi:hypothetical protein